MAEPRRRVPVVPIATVALVVLGAWGVWALRGYLASVPPPTKKVVQEIQVIRPPPPPPEAEPPPPPPPEEEVDIPDPQPLDEPDPSNEPPPSASLGVDADGTGGGDGFGLVGRKGGRDLLASGGSAFRWYAGLVKDRLLDELGADSKVRSGSYSVSVRVWLRHDGSVEQVKLVSSSGDRERDKAIEAALARVQKLSQPPPADMPQPINLRIVSRA
jgi:periplasmic protein TonB